MEALVTQDNPVPDDWPGLAETFAALSEPCLLLRATAPYEVVLGSAGWRDLSGREASTLLGQPAASSVPKGCHQLLIDLVEQVTRTGEARTGGPHRSHRSDGTTVWWECRLRPLRQTDGAVAFLILCARDVSEAQQLRQAYAEAREARESQRRLSERLALERTRLNDAQAVAHIGSWEFDLRAQALSWSDEAFRIFRVDPETFTVSYEAFVELVHPDDRERLEQAYAESLRNREPYAIEHRMVTPDGQVRHLHERCRTFYDEDGQPLRSVGTVQDITERKLAELAMRQAETVFDAANDAIVVTDAQARITSVNPAFTRITGYTEEEVLGRNPRLWASGRHGKSYYRQMWQAILNEGHWQGELWNLRKGGDVYPVWEAISAVRDDHGELTHFVSIFSDISQIKETEERLEHMAHHDALTGLPNRVLFGSNLDLALAFARRHRTSVAVLLLDLDRFKLINDTLGHVSGDQMLMQIGERLRKCAREQDTVARLGGDEFAVILNELEHPEDAVVVCEKVIAAVARPLSLQGKKIVTSASIGISLFPDDARNGPDLVRAADAAMYRAKARGRGTYGFYTADLSARAAEHLAVESDLHRALAQGELTLNYQPLVEIDSGRIAGVEALLRWQHPERGLIMPDQFIYIAEESGLIEQIGDWVLNTALDQLLDWSDAGIALPRMSVNISGREVLYEHLADTVIQALARHDRLPVDAVLELEVTENVLLSLERSGEVLGRLKDAGVMIAIDDFGTGYSSLSRLQHLPVDTLKIDRSFLVGVPDSHENSAIVSAIIAMGRNLGLRVIAEGVEVEEQLDFLRRQGCDEAQGFMLARPLPATRMTHMLQGAAAR